MGETKQIGHYKQIDALKGFAIFMVILAHSIILTPVDLHQDPVCSYLFVLLSNVHMPLFFVISGFCFSYRGDYGSYIVKKVKRLMVPYVVFNVIDMVFRKALSSLVNRPRGIWESVVKMLFYGGEFWFLYALFLIFLFYPVLYRWQKNSPKRMWLVSAVLLVISSLGISVELFRIFDLAHYLFFFQVGVQLRASQWPVFEKRKPAAVWPVAGILAIVWCVGLVFISEQPLWNALSALGIVVCYLLTQSDIFNNVFARFGEHSLQLYLLNGFALVVSRTLICKITQNPALIIGFNMLIDFGLSYVIIKYICRKLPVVRTLMGM